MKHLRSDALFLLVSVSSALAFPAVAEIMPIDESGLRDITGQAGVTIELETRVEIGEFRYTDEGSLSVYDISIGGYGMPTGAGSPETDYFGLNGWGPSTRQGDLLDDF